MEDWRRMWPVGFVLGALLFLAALLLALAPITSSGEDCGPLVASTDAGVLSGCSDARDTRTFAVIATGVVGAVLVVAANSAYWATRDESDRRNVV
jgi:hypothetical protein